MRNLNPDQLLTFMTVVDKGGFTQAARALNLTQPAVSLQIRELENRCGVPLLDREGRKPKPTEAGASLLLSAAKILAAHDAALADMRRHKEGALGRLRIGMSTTTLTYVAGKALRRLKQANPTLQLAVTIDTSPKLVNMTRDNDLDLAIVTLPIEEGNFRVTAVLEDELVAIVPSSPAELPRHATADYLAEQAMIVDYRQSTLRRTASQWFAEQNVAPRHHLELEHLEAIKGAVAAGLGVSIVPLLLVQSPPTEIRVLPLKPPIKRKLAAIQRADKPPTATVRKFLSMLDETTR